MLKTLVAAALLALLGATPAQAQSAPALSTSQTDRLFLGQMAGSWNTPINAEGFATGVLKLGVPQYLLAADVVLGPSPQGAGVQGTLSGTLAAFPLSPIADVYAEVAGTWTYDVATETGSFQALFFTPALGQPPGVPQVLLGSMSANFQDAYTPFGPDALGSFAGTWTLAAFAGGVPARG